METFRFGILGCGGIAHRFAQAIPLAGGAIVSACAARDATRAAAFAAQYGIAHSYGSYAELLDSGEVDAVYIATQHPYHVTIALEALARRIPVLCEKPLTVNAAQAEQLARAAAETGTFLMEAMWTRFMPLYAALQARIAQGCIGEIVRVEADFSCYNTFSPESRLFDMAAAGGVLIDMAIYPLTFAAIFLGESPERVLADLVLSPTGADMQNALLLRYAHGKQAVLTAAVTADAPVLGRVIGTKGYLDIPDFLQARRAILHRSDAPPETIESPEPSENGFEFEIREIMQCVRAQKAQNAVLPLEKTISILRLMDTVRQAHGIVYPCEASML